MTMATTKTPSGGVEKSRRKLARRACDSCKIRKIRCTELAPCASCVASGVPCTFNRHQAQRGPKGLRPRTMEKMGLGRDQMNSTPAAGPTGKGCELDQLLAILDVYSLRLSSVWPIVDTSKLSSALIADLDPERTGVWRLAATVALATIAQLKLPTSWKPDPQQVERLEVDRGSELLDSLRCSFFLHVYYENLEPGGIKALLYLREAITQAQILKLEHESVYTSLSEDDQHYCRRALWLLFITERGVALLHRLPVILKPRIAFPWSDTFQGGTFILPSFLKLVHLFWTFDQSGMFQLLQDLELDDADAGLSTRACLELLQQRLQETITTDDWSSGNEVQRADMLLTHQWLRAVLFRAALRFGVLSPTVNPLDIAKDFLSLVSQIPTTALESHGQTMEFKTYEIATTIIDSLLQNYPGVSVESAEGTLHALRNLLSRSRGGNKKLPSLLDMKWTNIPSTNDHSQGQIQSLSFTFMHRIDNQIPYLELGDLIRSPSPITRLLLENDNEHEYVEEIEPLT